MNAALSVDHRPGVSRLVRVEKDGRQLILTDLRRFDLPSRERQFQSVCGQWRLTKWWMTRDPPPPTRLAWPGG